MNQHFYHLMPTLAAGGGEPPGASCLGLFAREEPQRRHQGGNKIGRNIDHGQAHCRHALRGQAQAQKDGRHPFVFLGQIGGPAERFAARFWSVVLTVETDAGRLWFKENNPGQRFEARLAGELAELAPGAVLTPIAADVARDRMLTVDAGPVLRDRGMPSRMA